MREWLSDIEFLARHLGENLDQLRADLFNEAAAREAMLTPPPETIFSIRQPNGTTTIWIDRRLGDRTISGVASTPDLDQDGTKIQPMGCVVPALPVPLLFQHNDLIGEVVTVHISSREVSCVATIDKSEAGDQAWLGITGGDFRALSIGFKLGLRSCFLSQGAARAEIPNWLLTEISVVDKSSAKNKNTWLRIAQPQDAMSPAPLRAPSMSGGGR